MSLLALRGAICMSALWSPTGNRGHREFTGGCLNARIAPLADGRAARARPANRQPERLRRLRPSDTSGTARLPVRALDAESERS
jgi:hypothetical protein